MKILAVLVCSLLSIPLVVADQWVTVEVLSTTFATSGSLGTIQYKVPAAADQ